jgi:hemerythrin
MGKIIKNHVAPGIFWLEIPEADLRVLCGCPADCVKHLMREKLIRTHQINGVTCETGPNAILLSDLPIQKGNFANLAEFPVLQMLYRQGMLLPGHPNNNGTKPMLIGREDIVRAQMDYIYRGNYGLTTVEEIMETGISRALAEEMMRMKLRFAFGAIHPSEQLLEGKVVGSGKTEVKNGVFVSREDTNRYKFSYQGETTMVDLTLEPGQHFATPYELGSHRFDRQYFSVLHTGEGDGWDIYRPCMGSILCFQGRIYLIDAGPNIDHSLNAMGISSNEIDGIFHTHAHDDHFSGLTTLIRSDHRIKYYATRLVRESVNKKLSALMSLNEGEFEEFFDVHDLEFDQWNNIEGLEVLPIFSPHPVETNVFLFRTLWTDGYVQYAHLADIAAKSVLQNMITEDATQPGISQAFYDSIVEHYHTPTQLKKIDIGGGLIHGMAEDFREDPSEKIILAHTSERLSASQKEIGSEAAFGGHDVLISSKNDYIREQAGEYLKAFYPTVDKSELRMLLNCEQVSFNAGEIIIKNNEPPRFVYLLLTGNAEYIRPGDHSVRMLSSGALVGDLWALFQGKSLGTYRAFSNIKALALPATLYREFVDRNQVYGQIQNVQNVIDFLIETWLFGEGISYPLQLQLANQAQWVEGDALNEVAGLKLLQKGEAKLHKDGEFFHKLKPGAFWGEDSILQRPSKFQVTVSRKAKLLHFPDVEMLRGIPLLRWKLLEHLEELRHLN